MKRTISTLVISLILIFLSTKANAQTQFIVNLKMPPPGTLNMADFWNISVTNNSDSGKSVYLIGIATESKDGQIAKGTTVPFMLKKGMNIIKIKDLPKTPDIEYTASDPRYKESLVRAGKFPSGQYEICVKVISAVNNEELGSDCFDQEVIEAGLISLINPSDGEVIEAKAPVSFTWSPGGKIPEGGYTLKIVEVMNQQSNETAMKNNKAFFEKKGIKTTSFQYPNAAMKFEEGKKYCWGISSLNIVSEIWAISIKTKDKVINDTTKHPVKIKIETPPSGNCNCTFSVDALPPNAGLIFSTNISNPTLLCTGNQYDFVATPVSTGSFTFEWNLTDPGNTSSTATGSQFTLNPTSTGNYTLIVNSFSGGTQCCHIELFFSAGSISNTVTANTLSSLPSVCLGTSTLLSLDHIDQNDFDYQWLISAAPCVAPTSSDAISPVTIDPVTGNFSVPLSGWMSLTGFNGSTYTTPANLQAGEYCFSSIVKSKTSCAWSFSTPVSFVVFAPTVGTALTVNPNILCNTNSLQSVVINLQPGYTATQWTWYYSNLSSGGWVLMADQPDFFISNGVAIIHVLDEVSMTTNYKVILQNGSCPPVEVTTKVTFYDPPPDGFICVKPNIQTTPAPGLGACVNPYPACPTTWLPICIGCDALLTLTDINGNPYPGNIQWDFLVDEFDYSNGAPPQYSTNPLVTPPPDIVNGGWLPTGFTGNTSVNTNSLNTTTWYRAVINDPNGLCPDKIFYCVVLVIRPPAPPVIEPPGPITSCTVPLNQPLSLQSSYTADGLALEYMWTSPANPPGNWQPFPVQPFNAQDYGTYSLSIKNECGESVSEIIIEPENIPVALEPVPCCVCEGQCLTVTATNIPGVTYNWTSDDPGLTLDPNNTSNFITFCPVKPLTNFILEVTNASGCKNEIPFDIKVCPKIEMP
ncbi:MAG: hypothetical protein WAT71_07045 [Ignavibacteria bacterium]